MSDTSIAGIGDNDPPLISVDELALDHFDSLDAVQKMAERANGTKRSIDNVEDLGVVAVLVRDVRELNNKTEAKRKIVKYPYLTASTTVDAFFGQMTERLEKIIKTFQAIGDDYQRKVAAEARRVAEQKARELRQEQDRQRELAAKAEAANRAKTVVTHQERADDAGIAANRFETEARQKPADLVRTRTATGVLATARTEWTFEIENDLIIPLDTLRFYIKKEHIEAAIRVAVSMGVREIEGVRIFEQTKASFR